MIDKRLFWKTIDKFRAKHLWKKIKINGNYFIQLMANQEIINLKKIFKIYKTQSF